MMSKEGLNEITEPDRADLVTDGFSELFPEGSMIKIQESEIPAVAMEIFEMESEQLIDLDKYQPRNFEAYLVINHANGDRTFLAQQTKTYDTNNDTERLTYFVDMRDGKVLGFSELRNNISNPSEYFYDKPFVGYTETEKDFRNQGLGTRRLLLMNAFSKSFYHLPLHSDTLNSEVNIWDNLVKKGLAKQYMEGENLRYSFNPTIDPNT